MEQKEALEYLVGLGCNENPIVETSLGVYSKTQLIRMEKPIADSLIVSTLTGLVDYIKSNVDNIEGELLVQIKSHKEVKLYSPLNVDRQRERFIVAEAI